MVTAEWREQPQKRYDNSKNEGHLFINYVFLHFHLHRALPSVFGTSLLCGGVSPQVPTPDAADNDPDDCLVRLTRNILPRICRNNISQGRRAQIYNSQFNLFPSTL